MPSEPLEARCSCHRHPLLAVCGRTDDGLGFVQIKAWKGQRLLTEAIVTSGVVNIKCRECFRWHCIKLVYGKTPEEIQNKPPGPQILSVLEDLAR